VKAIFVQGEAFYGFNLRLLTDKQADVLLNTHPAGPWEENNQVVEIIDIPDGFLMGTASIGYDSGCWEEGEAVLSKLLKVAGKGRKAAGRKGRK
jgi:hypothetical protein